jgi:hypothetical protein
VPRGRRPPEEAGLTTGEAQRQRPGVARTRSLPPSPAPFGRSGPETATAGAALPRALAAAEDALSRLDAGALAAPAALREGLAARLAFRQPNGWLAHTEAWVHPLDLALCDLGLPAPTSSPLPRAASAPPCR